MTKNKLVCALAWRENEGEANKNYFVCLTDLLLFTNCFTAL